MSVSSDNFFNEFEEGENHGESYIVEINRNPRIRNVMYYSEMPVDLDEENPDFLNTEEDLLLEYDAHTSSIALQQMQMPDFANEDFSNKTFFEIIFKINGLEGNYLEDNKEKINSILLEKFSYEKSVMIIFKSTVFENQRKIFFRCANNENFFILQLSEDVDNILLEYTKNFIIAEIKKKKSGILDSSKNKNKFDLRDIGSSKGRNLLMIAIIRKDIEIVQKLLEHGFDIDYEDDCSNNAIEIAWLKYINTAEIETKTVFNNIIIGLLNQNSKFPRGFNIELASDEIIQIIKLYEKIHEYVEYDKEEELKEKLSENDNLCHVYDTKNQSLIAHALSLKKFKIHELLMTHNMSTGNHETNDLEKIFSKYENFELRRVRVKNQELSLDFPKTHLLVLRSKSKIASNDKKVLYKINDIEKAFKILDANISCSEILKVAATSRKLSIFFDFKNDSAYYLDPTSSKYTKGITYSSGIIHVGAKDLASEQKRYEVIGVLIHELCHLAMLMTFMNDFEPFKMGRSKKQSKFKNKIIKECKQNQDSEIWVKNVFSSYFPEHYSSELIVVVLQILMHYHNNQSHIDLCKKKFPKLFNYFSNYVLPELKNALPVLKALFDETMTVNFKNLTKPMKAKILYSKIQFQGISTTFQSITKNDNAILNILPSNDIKDCLINNKKFIIGDKCKTSTKYDIIERNFVDYDANPKQADYDNKIKDTNQIQNDIALSKIFILADMAGAGKSIIFEHLTNKLKDDNKEFWVSYIKLRSYREIFEKYHEEINFNADKLLEVLLEILNIKLQIEKAIFTKLFSENKVILLFDGVDEVHSKYNNFLVNILHAYKNTRNQLWISTRPQHIKQLTNEFNAGIFKLVPYTKKDKENFITDILKKSGEQDDDKIKEILNDFEFFFKSIKKENYSNYTEVENPLMIRIIVELYVNKKIDLKSMSFELFGTYQKIIDELRERTNEERRGDDSDSFEVNFTIVHVHQVLALIFLFDDKDDGFKIKKLSILKKWKREKINWKVHKIQHYGFITTDSDDQNDGSFDFTHYTFAEFFVAKFIIWYLYQSDDDIKDEEFKKTFEFIKEVALKYDFKNILSFIFSYLRDQSRSYKQLKIKKYITDELESIRDDSNPYYHISRKKLKFFSVLLVRELDTLRSLWQTNETQNFLRKILTKENYFQNSDLGEIFEILEISFRCDWHKEFNKSGKDLISSEYITRVMDENIYCAEFNRNLLKFIDLIEKNYKPEEIASIYINRFLRDNFVEKINDYSIKIILDKSVNIFAAKEEMFIKMLASFVSLSSDKNVFKYLGDNIERLLSNNAEKIKQVLFLSKYCNFMYPLLWAVKMKDAEIFQIFKNLYIKYGSPNEIVDKLKSEGIILKLFSSLNYETNILEEFINKLFELNKNQFVECITGDISEILINEQKFKFFENFLLKFLNNNKNLVQNCMQNILFNTSNVNSHPLFKVIENNDLEKLNIAKNLYIKFKDNNSWDKIRNMFINSSIIFSIFNAKISDEIYEDVKKFVLKAFESDKESIADTINDEGRDLIEDENKFKIFEKFIEEFFDNDADKIKACIRKVLLRDYYNESHILLEILTKNDIKEFERVKDLYLKYLTSEELQEIFTTKQILVGMLIELTADRVDLFQTFMVQVFVNNENKLSESINDKNGYKLIESEEKFEIVEKFLKFFFKNDSNSNFEIKKCIRKILFYDYDENFHPLVLVLKTNDPVKFERFRKIYSKYKDSWDELQKNFMSEKIFVSLFSEMTDEIFLTFKQFVLEIFESDKKKLYDYFNDKNNFKRNKISALVKHKNKYIQEFVKFACESFRN